MRGTGRARRENKAAARNQPTDAALTLARMRVRFTRHPRPPPERADHPPEDHKADAPNYPCGTSRTASALE